MLVTGRFNDVCHDVLGAAIEVHRHLGPGLLESMYLRCLVHELQARGSAVATQRTVPIVYKTLSLDANYRIDLQVDDLVVVEVKAVAQVIPVHKAQLLTCVRLMDHPAGPPLSPCPPE